jgi:hypothetical protein
MVKYIGKVYDLEEIVLKRYRLQIGDNKNEVYLLGYRLSVTPCEYKLLLAIAREKRVGIESLTKEIGLAPDKKGNVAVHICSLNRKAQVIGDRKLILCESSEYFFNENM